MSYDTRLLLRESAPVVVILAFWGIVSSILHPELFNAGLLMALLYTVVRGLALPQSYQSPAQPADLSGILRENAHVAIPAVVWVLLAHLVAPLSLEILPFLLAEIAEDIIEGIASGLRWAGVAVVLLYAIAVGVPRVRTTLTEPSAVND